MQQASGSLALQPAAASCESVRRCRAQQCLRRKGAPHVPCAAPAVRQPPGARFPTRVNKSDVAEERSLATLAHRTCVFSRRVCVFSRR
eukprot:905657-Rhodomonas_salina.2